MKPFDIFGWQPPGWPEPHPCVIVSHPSRVANKGEVNVVACSSRRATRPATANEIILDAADGLDWPTLCKCDLLYSVPKPELKHRRGQVSSERKKSERKKLLVRTMLGALGWGEVLAAA